MLASRRTYDHDINLKEGAKPHPGPFYLMSANQLSELDKYLKKMLAEGKIADTESPYSAPIVFVPNQMPVYDNAWTIGTSIS